MKKTDEENELITYLIDKRITKRCAYLGCKRMVRFLVRDGRKDYFIPLCDFHRYKYETFDDPHIEERYRRYKRREKKK